MMYKVLNEFYDKQDGYYLYRKGESYPRSGKTVTAERIAELSTDKNAMGIPLIAEADDNIPENESEIQPETKPKRKGRVRNSDTSDGDMQ